MKTTIQEIEEFFDQHNICISICYSDYKSLSGDPIPELEMTFEDSHGQTVYLDHFWEGRIKAYNLIPKKDTTE